MIDPRLRPSIDINDDPDESGSEEFSEPASMLTNDVFLPQVLGQETYELEFFTHRRYLAPCGSNSEAISKPVHSSKRPLNATVCGFVGRIAPPDIRRWFRQPYDPEFLAHLLDLYFCWIHPSYQIFSRDHFLRDFQSGQTDYCSRVLANAIAAFACSYSDRVAALADPNDPSTAGDQFFAEADQLLQHGSESPPMLALALNIMSFRELACGRISTSHFYTAKCRSMEYQHAPSLTPTTNGTKDVFCTQWDVPQ